MNEQTKAIISYYKLMQAIEPNSGYQQKIAELIAKASA